MDDTLVIVLVVAAVIVIAGVVAWVMVRRRRTERLRTRFGPEYERAVRESGKVGAAESELRAREDRRAKLDIRPLEPVARDRYLQSWGEVQARFVDGPGGAVQQADQLVLMVMRDRGYPVDEFAQREADISVDHPQVVDDYRAAHAISLANEHGRATTEDLRQAMVHYRSLFDRLLDPGQQADDPRVVG